MFLKKFFASLLVVAGVFCQADETAQEFVSYEKFGAKGDGKTDDQLAIAAAHDFANAAKLPVRANDKARYYIGGGNRVITIATDTDFGKAEFIIDDTRVKKRSSPIFSVKSRKKDYQLKELTSLYKHQTRLPIQLKSDSLLVLTNNGPTRSLT